MTDFNNYKKSEISNEDILRVLSQNSELKEDIAKLISQHQIIQEEEGAGKRHVKGTRKTRPLEPEEFEEIIKLVLNGFDYVDNKGVTRKFLPNKELGLILTLEASLGLRISDVLKLTVNDIRKGKLEVTEKKTGKLNYRKIPSSLVDVVRDYALDNGLKANDRLTNMSDSNVRKRLSIVTKKLGYKNIGSHSFRKYFARTVIDKTGDIELVRVLLNHSSLAVTQNYLGVSQKKIDETSESIDFSETFSSHLNNSQ